MEALFRSPGAFVHSEIEVSSHCICNTGSLRQNIIPNITQTPHHCCFIVSLLPQLSPALRALFLSSLHCHTFNHKTTREILLNGLIYFFGTFSSHLASPILARVFHRGKITEGYYKSARVLQAVKKSWPIVVDCEDHSHQQNLLKHIAATCFSVCCTNKFPVYHEGCACSYTYTCNVMFPLESAVHCGHAAAALHAVLLDSRLSLVLPVRHSLSYCRYLGNRTPLFCMINTFCVVMTQITEQNMSAVVCKKNVWSIFYVRASMLFSFGFFSYFRTWTMIW